MFEQGEHRADQPSKWSDEELVARSLGGDTEAFGVLVLRYRAVVTGVAYRIAGDAALADDVAQETFIRLWSKLAAFRPEGNLKGWVCRIAANLTIDALRRQKPTTDISQLALAAGGKGPEGAVLSSERATQVRAALMRLPVDSRTVLVLREYEGLSYQEIADALRVPLGTVKSRLNDARRRLKDELCAYLED
jgi:RNA polymerase sigma-70 factor (ECF subfamily)